MKTYAVTLERTILVTCTLNVGARDKRSAAMKAGQAVNDASWVSFSESEAKIKAIEIVNALPPRDVVELAVQRLETAVAEGATDESIVRPGKRRAGG